MPLVFLHGLGLDGRAYVRLLSWIGGLGFTVIAVDTAGDHRLRDFSSKPATMRRHRIPTIVVHSENDGVAPFVNAVDMAERTDGALYRVPPARHSWMLAHPGQAAEMMGLLLRAELRAALRAAGSAALLCRHSALRHLTPTRVHYLGVEEPRPVHIQRLRTDPAPRRAAPIGMAG